MLTTFFKELPYDIEEAALIDGCSRWQALRLVVFPLAAPGVFTAALLVFIHAWNEFFFALIILTYPAVQTLPVGIGRFLANHHALGRNSRGFDHRDTALDCADCDFSTAHRAGVVGGCGERIRKILDFGFSILD